MKLSVDKQKKYIRELRKIAVEFAKKNPLAAKQMAKENSLFAMLVGGLVETAHADEPEDRGFDANVERSKQIRQRAAKSKIDYNVTKVDLAKAEEKKRAARKALENITNEKDRLEEETASLRRRQNEIRAKIEELRSHNYDENTSTQAQMAHEAQLSQETARLESLRSQGAPKELRLQAIKTADLNAAKTQLSRAEETVTEAQHNTAQAQREMELSQLEHERVQTRELLDPSSVPLPTPAAGSASPASNGAQQPATPPTSSPTTTASTTVDPLAEAVNNATRNSDIPVPPATASQETPAPTPGAGTPTAAQVPSGDVRCMFGGFVIYGDACTSVDSASSPLYGSNISAAATVEEGAHKFVINPSNLNCAGGSPEDRVLCNPLIFGTRKDGKAICVTQAKNSTALCQNESAKDDDISVASAMALAKANPAAWNALAASWDNLCKDDKIASNRYLKGRAQAQQDVKDTCAAAKSRFDGVRRGLGLTPRPSPQSPETSPAATPATAEPAGAINEGHDPGHAH